MLVGPHHVVSPSTLVNATCINQLLPSGSHGCSCLIHSMATRRSFVYFCIVYRRRRCSPCRRRCRAVTRPLHSPPLIDRPAARPAAAAAPSPGTAHR